MDCPRDWPEGSVDVPENCQRSGLEFRESSRKAGGDRNVPGGQVGGQKSMRRRTRARSTSRGTVRPPQSSKQPPRGEAGENPALVRNRERRTQVTPQAGVPRVG